MRVWRRALSGFFYLAVVALCINAMRLAGPRMRAKAQDTTGVTPYTVILTENMIDGSGNSHPGSLFTTAVRSDGSIVRKR